MKFAKKLFVVVTLVFASVALIACKDNTPVVTDADPVFAGVGAASIELYATFDPLAGVTVSDAEDGDLTASIVVTSNNVDNTVVGSYTVVYTVTDSFGNVVTATRTVTVNALAAEDYPLANYLSGVNLSQLGPEDKGILFAAAENYLLENVYAGVPLYTRASRVMYSERTQLFSQDYNGVMGFGASFSQFTQDDSHVLMYGDTYGQAGEYTWRDSYNTDPTTLNPWVADDSSTDAFNGLINGGLFDFFFDASKTGYEILPSLAASEPNPVDPTEINGKTYATTWEITLRDDLQWNFNSRFDTSVLPAGFEKLDVDDYLWTWKYALDHSWFRAYTGGGDFVSQGIKNVSEYLSGSANWEDVGIKKSTTKANTIELTYSTEKSTFEIKYGFAGNVLSPINQQLFEYLGPDNYGLDPESVASSGVYVFDTWTPGQLLTYVKNPLHPDSALYHYTGYQYRYINGSDQIFAEFLAGRLESAAVPASQITQYAADPRVKVAPDATTWRLMINGFGTTAERDAYIAAHPEIGIDDNWVPEPILSYLPMRQALYYGFDRYYAAVDLVKAYLPAFTLFTPTYFLDAASGISVRGTDAGAALLDKFGGGSYGYFPDAAVDLFKEAVAQAIADGYYDAGTSDNYTVITLDLYWASSGNTGAQTMVQELIKEYEDLLVDDVNFVRLDIVNNDVAFPNNYYDYMMVAKMDLGIGGISGSLLDAPSFLDVFCDDNRGGFTLNWGIDTSTANIPVAYHNMEGKLVYEMWSYNALVEALNGKTYIKNGLQQEAWPDADSLINAYLDMGGETLASSIDGTVLAGYVLGDDLSTIATDNGFDALVAKIVVTESGKNILFVVSQEGTDFKLYQQSALSSTAEAAIQNDLDQYGYTLNTATLLDDAGIAANAYISANYGYTSVAEVATDFGIPAEYTEVWAINRTSGSGSVGDDAYVLLHIGDYYIAWSWL